jgi:hypothetical protein
MVQFVTTEHMASPTASWNALAAKWNSLHDVHRYGSGCSMKGAYYTAVRLNRGERRVPDTCDACVLEVFYAQEAAQRCQSD